MNYSSIQGQEEAIRVLKGAIAAGKPGHAYLFYGAPGVGKSTVALAFAQALNCERGGPEACGECLTCRRAEHSNLRDIEIVEPGSKSGQTIDIDQVRDLIARASTRPTEGRRKVFLIPQTGRLSPPAMQTLLKTLEEPPDFVTIVLETREMSELPPTLISRCQTVRFRRLSREAVIGILSRLGADRKKAPVAAAFSQGCLTDALALATDNAVWKRRERILQLLSEIATTPRPQALRIAEALQKLGAASKAEKSSEEENAEDEADASGSPSNEHEAAGEEASTPRAARAGMSDALTVVSAWLSDLLALSAGADADALRNPDFSENLKNASQHYSADQLYQALDYALKGDYYLQRNANPRLFCENLIFRICPTDFPALAARRKR